MKVTIKRLATLLVILSAIMTVAATSAHGEPTTPPEGYCSVTLCNKLERLTLNPWNMMKDKAGEICSRALIEKEYAVQGKRVSSESRWYQGTFNPTKKSVTRVSYVHACG